MSAYKLNSARVARRSSPYWRRCQGVRRALNLMPLGPCAQAPRQKQASKSKLTSSFFSARLPQQGNKLKKPMVMMSREVLM
jgi:hypothetical protein